MSIYQLNLSSGRCRADVPSRFGRGSAALLTLVLLLSILQPCNAGEGGDYAPLKEGLIARFGALTPREWGERVTGVKSRIAGSAGVVALTLDACGSPRGMGLDRRLMEFLEREKIPATLFINGRWIEPNRADFDRLAKSPLFEIANHGHRHRPASATGRAAYGIAGTASVAELVDEIELNARTITELTGRRPRFYRSGTAYYDEVAVQVAAALGHQVAGFSLLGDAGATFTREQVRSALLGARGGDIVILHMNRPESGTAAGVMDAIPELKRRGLRFVRLSEMELE
jgi:peptidoglycan/xylan/chitin deacetylase (PgdA/CDA1 family)